MSGVALVGREGGRFALEEIVTAPIGPTDVGVRTTWSGVSIGTEFAALTGKLDYGPFPITTGYMGVGIIEKVGSDVAGFGIGDRLYYGCNNDLRTREGDEQITCASGVHASVAVVDPLGPGMGGHSAQGWAAPSCPTGFPTMSRACSSFPRLGCWAWTWPT